MDENLERLKELNRALEIRPGEVELHREKVQILRDMEDRHNLRRALETAAASTGAGEFLFQRGLYSEKAQKFLDAQEWFQFAHRSMEGDAELEDALERVRLPAARCWGLEFIEDNRAVARYVGAVEEFDGLHAIVESSQSVEEIKDATQRMKRRLRELLRRKARGEQDD